MKEFKTEEVALTEKTFFTKDAQLTTNLSTIPDKLDMNGKAAKRGMVKTCIENHY